MNKKIRTILVSIAVLLFGCEKVIDVDLNEADPEFVIEANLTNSINLAEVKVSKTGSYFGDTPIEKITGAVVNIEDEFGKGYNLHEVEDGVYRTFEIMPMENVTYHLRVETEGHKFESSSKLNPVVLIDSLKYYYDDGFVFLNEGYIVKMYFSDPSNRKNYYRVKVFENDTLRNSPDEFILFDDRMINGKSLELTLHGIIFDPGDKATVQLVSLDEAAYQYYNTFQELINVNPGSAAPANPISNISNGALGYFAAWSADTKTVIIKE